ncbi:hypothetical protein RND81_08G095200 [Saponaria officinalis]|uniref:Endonuclease/exonuclease/phosphatase domain-containing protein n=1 Tax=Saponaria officinalis TaxID=3572 RepID=A0AAW1J640_SAPOF
MKIGVWNIRGMNDRIKQHEVVDMFRHNNLDLLGINESRVRVGRFESICRQKFKALQVLNYYSHHPNGRLWVLWKRDDLQVQVFDVGDQWVHLQVSEIGMQTYLATFVYGLNDRVGRVPLWDFLKRVTAHIPWVVLGDFNCVRSISEMISCAPPDLPAMDDFNDATCRARLDDLSTHGCQYTWTNKQSDSDRKWMRLDRALVNSDWRLLFPFSYADALCSGVSDHSSIVVTVSASNERGPQQFHFLNCWVEDDHFLPLVADVWKTKMAGCPMFKMFARLKLVKNSLRSLHRSRYSKISDRVIVIQRRLRECQSKISLDPMNLDLWRRRNDSAMIFAN